MHPLCELKLNAMIGFFFVNIIMERLVNEGQNGCYHRPDDAQIMNISTSLRDRKWLWQRGTGTRSIKMDIDCRSLVGHMYLIFGSIIFVCFCDRNSRTSSRVGLDVVYANIIVFDYMTFDSSRVI